MDDRSEGKLSLTIDESTVRSITVLADDRDLDDVDDEMQPTSPTPAD
jgi:hypothetical protein